MWNPPLLRSALLGLALLAPLTSQSADAGADALPLFDAHVHYSHDAVARIGAEQVLALMRQAGLRRAMVSSSDDEGTQKLYRLAPDLIVPSLRPYRLRSDVSTWVRDAGIIDYLEQRLTRHRYAAIGEFHLYGADADLPVPRRMIALSQQHQLILHAHSDIDAVERIFRQAPNATVLWAHSGFERPEAVRDMLRKHPRLYADLAYRTDQADPEWTAVFMALPERFVVGTDTFTPERLYYIPDHARFSRQWLKALPAAVAERIGWRNGETLMASFWDARAAAGCAPGPGQAPEPNTALSASLQLRAKAGEGPGVGEPFGLQVIVCPRQAGARITGLSLEASMPEHQHGMNYRPRLSQSAFPSAGAGARRLEAEGLLFHMPGKWLIEVTVQGQDSQGQPWSKPERLRFVHTQR